MFLIFIFILFLYLPLLDAIKMSPYPIVPFFTHVTLGKVIFLNPFTWNHEILVHEIAHAIRGDPGKNDHDRE